MDWYFAVIKKYAVFSGRARRKEYWTFFFINMAAVLGLTVLDISAGLFSKELGLGLFGGVYTLLLLLPALGVCVRRLHDTARSGWWLLLAFVPLLGLVLVYFYCLEGTRGVNEYGDDPKPPDLPYAPPKPENLAFPGAPQFPPPPPPQN